MFQDLDPQSSQALEMIHKKQCTTDDMELPHELLLGYNAMHLTRQDIEILLSSDISGGAFLLPVKINDSC